MRDAVAAARRRIGHRGSALLFFAALDLVYSGSLLFPDSAARRGTMLLFLALLAPLWVWALLWGVVGVICVVFSVQHHDQVAFTLAIGLKVLWGVLALGGWLVMGVDRGWLAAAIWLCFAAFAAAIASWPEPPSGWKALTWTPPSS